MKNLLLFIFVAILWSSCKKEWTCTCTYKYELGTYSTTSTKTYVSEKMSRKNADEWCDQYSHEEPGYSRTCELTK